MEKTSTVTLFFLSFLPTLHNLQTKYVDVYNGKMEGEAYLGDTEQEHGTRCHHGMIKGLSEI
jgi:hypothetical protein